MDSTMIPVGQRLCAYCDADLDPPSRKVSRRVRDAYDPHLGRLWKICPRCERWNPVPIESRWEALELWEESVRSDGRVVLESDHLALISVGSREVVRVGRPSFVEWGDWRYGTRISLRGGARGFLSRLVARLPPPPIEGYDPYAIATTPGGVTGRRSYSNWLASPFVEHANALTIGFTSVPFAQACPSCRLPMPLAPWRFASVSFEITSGVVGVEADCAACDTRVIVPLDEARPALRLGLAMMDSGPDARRLGEIAGRGLDGLGGSVNMIRGLGRSGMTLGEMDRTERVALGMAMDDLAEAHALETQWREAEELTSIMDGELTEVPGFLEFRARILEGT